MTAGRALLQRARSDDAPDVVAVLMVLAGFGAVAVASAGVFAHQIVALQVPYAISGGLGGLAAIGGGTSLIVIQRRRVAAARQFGEVLALVREAVQRAAEPAARGHSR